MRHSLRTVLVRKKNTLTWEILSCTVQELEYTGEMRLVAGMRDFGHAFLVLDKKLKKKAVISFK
jgi:hypothetical protein